MGTDPDQLPLEEQVREDEPDNPYPMLQVYVALPLTLRVFTLTTPLLGDLSEGQTTPELDTTLINYTRHNELNIEPIYNIPCNGKIWRMSHLNVIGGF